MQASSVAWPQQCQGETHDPGTTISTAAKLMETARTGFAFERRDKSRQFVPKDAGH